MVETEIFNVLWEKLEASMLTQDEYNQLDDMVEIEFVDAIDNANLQNSTMLDMYDDYFILITKQFDRWIEKLEKQKPKDMSMKSKEYYERVRTEKNMKRG